jgi:hypothetical protein
MPSEPSVAAVIVSLLVLTRVYSSLLRRSIGVRATAALTRVPISKGASARPRRCRPLGPMVTTPAGPFAFFERGLRIPGQGPAALPAS